MPRESRAASTAFGEPTQFLRAINLRLDADWPERIAHFWPTAKTAPLLRSLTAENGDSTCLVVAPYGSGKSITASYALQLVENRPEAGDTLAQIEDRLTSVSPELARFATFRRRRGTRGLAVALHGPVPALAPAIRAAALEAMERQKLGRQARPIRRLPATSIEDALAVLAEVNEKLSTAGYDRVAILWDEFGRHLETLVAEGRTHELGEVQLLAEFAARSGHFPTSLGLLLHQDMAHYAGGASQAVRMEWKKIEGRFRTLHYVDDSSEVYRLVAEIVAARRSTTPPTRGTIGTAASALQGLGLFPDFSKTELHELLTKAYPLEPVSLYLLPRVSARVAQHERTLFNLLFSLELDQPVDPASLFDYFSADMQSDTAVGGTYRQWLETQSALSKVRDDDEARALKSACLLTLGLGGERTRASRELVHEALRGFRPPDGEKELLNRLLHSKLLVHRIHNDEVSVWHGTDQDLRGRLEEEKRRSQGHFDLIEFLTHELPPPAVRPLEYNDEFHVRRYLTGEYHDVSSLRRLLELDPMEVLPPGTDGKILYVVPSGAEEIAELEQLLETLSTDRLLAVLPDEPISVRDTAAEVWCLRRMEGDTKLVGSDPLVLPELQQMADDARNHLGRLLDRLTTPSAQGPRWFSAGEARRVASHRELQDWLSRLMEEAFPLTPRINNELIVRNRPSAPIVNGRKKLLLGILERTGQESLGIEGNRPDASMLRTVLLHTGLYRERRGEWGFAPPDEVEDKGLRAVWATIGEFLTAPADEPKNFRSVLEKLQLPPYGLRAGVLPILLGGGFRAFNGPRSLLRRGEYVDDILASEIEDICKSPDDYRLKVLEVSPRTLTFVRGLLRLFTVNDTSESDVLRQAFDALQAWKTTIPSGALPVGMVSPEAKAFHAELQRELDPVDLVLGRIPAAMGLPLSWPRKLLAAVENAKTELEGVESAYVSHAEAIVRKHLGFGGEDELGVRNTAAAWGECFPSQFAATLPLGVAKGVLTRVRMPYTSDRKLLDSLSSLLVGRSLARWDNSTIFSFDRELQAAVRTVEETALSSDLAVGPGTGREGLALLIRGRIRELHRRLARLVGDEDAARTVQAVTNSGEDYGDDTRRSRESVG